MFSSHAASTALAVAVFVIFFATLSSGLTSGDVLGAVGLSITALAS